MNEFDGLAIEKWEDQVIDITEWRYASPAMICDIFYHHGDEWARRAAASGWIPYYDEIGFVRWKCKRS